MATISRVSDTDIFTDRMKSIVENLKADTGINVTLTNRMPDKYRYYTELPKFSIYPFDFSEIGVMDTTTIRLERVKIFGLSAISYVSPSPNLYAYFVGVIERDYEILVADLTNTVINKDRPVFLLVTTDRDCVIDSYRLNLALYGYFTSEERFYNALRL